MGTYTAKTRTVGRRPRSKRLRELGGTVTISNGGQPDLSPYELLSNKVTEVDQNSTDEQYPTAKLLYDLYAALGALIEALDEGKQDAIADLAAIRSGAALGATALQAITAAAGSDIGTVGTPSVTVSTQGSSTTLTFHQLKGAKGDKGDKGDTGETGPQGPAGTGATVDSALSSTSTNPVQNKVVKTALDGKAASSHTHSYNNLTDRPTAGQGLVYGNGQFKIGNGALAHIHLQSVGSGYVLVTINDYRLHMLAFTIRLYAGYDFDDYIISGYNYHQQGYQWYSPAVTHISQSGTPRTIYFGYTSSGHLWVAVPNRNYTGCGIFNLINGYEQVATLDGLFTMTLVSSLPGTIERSVVTSPLTSQSYVAARYLPLSGGTVSDQAITAAKSVVEVNAVCTAPTANIAVYGLKVELTCTGTPPTNTTAAAIYGSATFGYAGYFNGGVKVTTTLTANSVSATTVYQTSDDRLKDYLGDFHFNLADLDRIPLRFFNFKADKERRVLLGTSAQAVQKVLPEIVGSEPADDGEEYLSVDYSKLALVALDCVRQLRDEVATMKAEMAAMRAEIKELKSGR